MRKNSNGRESYLFDRATIADIQRAANDGIYKIRGFGAKRKVPHFDDLVFFTKFLLLCRENINDAQQYVPEFLDDIIQKSLNCIKYFRTPNGQMPLFNGASENNLEKFDKYLEKIKY